MSIYFRRIIFTVFICIFLLSATAILFYGSGYRWNSAKKTIEKTGQLSLDSLPRGGEIYVEGERVRRRWKKIIGSSMNQTTPASIQHLLPGEYTVEIKKDGYYPWKKLVRVFSGQTTLFHGIRLLKNEMPQQMIAGEILQSFILPNTTLAVLTKKDFFLTDVSKKRVQPLLHLDKSEFVSYIASPDGNYFFLRSRDAQWVIDTSGRRTKITRDGESMFLTVRWSRDNQLFGRTKDGIVQVSLTPFKLKKIIGGVVDDFFIRDERLFTIEGKKNKSVRMRELVHGNKESIEVVSLSTLGGNFLDDPSHDIAIQRKEGGIIVLSPAIGKNTFNILELENIAKVSEKNNDVFLGWSDVELWQYTLSGREYGKTFITRQSIPLQKAFFSRSVSAVFFLSNNALTMINMADESRNQIQMFRWERIVDIVASKNEKEFFISGTFNGAPGLYVLRIVD